MFVLLLCVLHTLFNILLTVHVPKIHKVNMVPPSACLVSQVSLLNEKIDFIGGAGLHDYNRSGNSIDYVLIHLYNYPARMRKG